MSQSLSAVILHVVFSTKDRAPSLGDTVRAPLHAYLAVVTRNAGCECYRVGGIADHVHLAIRVSRTISVSTLLQELKTTSSRWLKAQTPTLTNFAWQRGYGAFSVAPPGLEPLRKYIDSQEDHHRQRTFQEEYRELLRYHGVEFDERYVWD